MGTGILSNLITDFILLDPRMGLNWSGGGS